MTISRHRCHVTAGATTLAPTSGSLEMDVGWSPFISGRFELPYSPDFAQLDPRQEPAPRVQVRVQQAFGDSDPAWLVSDLHAGKTAAQISAEYAGTLASDISALHFHPFNTFGLRAPTSRTFDLTVRKCTTDEAAGQVTLAVASDEALAVDFALVRTEPLVFQSSSVRAIVSGALSVAGWRLAAGDPDGMIEDDSAIWEPGKSLWDFLAPYVQQAGLRLWVGSDRRWRLDYAERESRGHTHLSIATVTRAESEIDREGDWYDAVVVRYRWTDAFDLQRTAYDVARDGNPSKVLTLEYDDTRYPGPGAARHVLNRVSGRGEAFPVEAVSNYDIVPGWTVTLSRPDRHDLFGEVSAISWSWPDDEMSIRTKDALAIAETAWMNWPTGFSWSDAQTAMPWNNAELPG